MYKILVIINQRPGPINLCEGSVKVIACIDDQQVIDKIRAYLKKKDGLPSPPDALSETRAPPQASLFG